jgi:hypothetical protein
MKKPPRRFRRAGRFSGWNESRFPRGQEPLTEQKRDGYLGSCVGGLTIDLATNEKAYRFAVGFFVALLRIKGV